MQSDRGVIVTEEATKAGPDTDPLDRFLLTLWDRVLAQKVSSGVHVGISVPGLGDFVSQSNRQQSLLSRDCRRFLYLQWGRLFVLIKMEVVVHD